MARLQILELPVGAGDDRPPFVLVIDEYQPRRYIPGAGQTEQTVDEFDGIAERIGARAVLTFVEAVDIPENAAPVAADTDTELAGITEIAHEYEETRLDLCGALLLPGDATWWKIVETVSERQRKLAGLCRKLDATKDDPADARVYLGDVEVGSVSSTSGEKPDRLAAERDEARMWARHGYEIGQKHCGWSDHGVAPDWLTEGWPYSFDSCEHLKQAAEYNEALTRVRGLHRPVEYHGRTICAECSGYGGQSTDNAPVDHDKCDTLRALTVGNADESTVAP